MTITQEQAASLFHSAIIAGRVAETIDEQAAVAISDADLFTAAVRELRERVAAGSLEQEAREDIAADLVRYAEKLLDFALAVSA